MKPFRLPFFLFLKGNFYNKFTKGLVDSNNCCITYFFIGVCFSFLTLLFGNLNPCLFVNLSGLFSQSLVEFFGNKYLHY